MSELTQVLRHLLPVEDPRALVDASTGDDAAVYLLSEERALVVSSDFFTPVVDDAYDFGRIAAANALSDLYAMGARPLFALNLVAFPRELLGDGVLERIVEGGGAACREAGIAVLGGHSIDDPEPKFGLVAVGEVHPDALVRNSGARAGDRLVLTKPIGSGVVATAIKAEAADEATAAAAVAAMSTLNRGAAEAMAVADVRGATDVTGFGLLGHLRAMLRASSDAAGSGLGAEIDAAAVPLLPGARVLADEGHVPGGTKRNRDDLAEDVDFGDAVPEGLRVLLCDAQTSGGLLMAVPEARLEGLLAGLEGRAAVAAVVGRVTEGRRGSVRVG